VLSFASARYLGRDLHRDTPRVLYQAAKRWGLSLGMPRLLARDPWTVQLERLLANLTGQEAALLFPSTTHLALDVLPLLAGPGGALLLDAQAYPISLEGARAAGARGATIARFQHNNPGSLERALAALAKRRLAEGARRVIVVDGVYAAGYHPAPLDRLHALAGRYGAWLYVDDAHGLGVLGRAPSPAQPYGQGGGGTPAFFGLPPGRVLHAASLSKAFGVPLAFAAGPARCIRALHARAASILHSSPPAIPLAAAACAALRAHAACGDELRARLLQRVKQFRAQIPAAGDHAFPIQTLFFPTASAAWQAALRFRKRGIWPVLQLHPPDNPQGGALRFLITADHTEEDLARLAE
jgi:8-amino-7-oxononanoate synthase